MKMEMYYGPNNETATPLDCVLCDPTKATVSWPGPDWYWIKCDRCGIFMLEGQLAAILTGKLPSQTVKVGQADYYLLGGYTREQSELWGPECLECATLEQILASCPRTVREKANKLLTAIHRRTEYFGEKVKLVPENDYRLGYAKNKAEFMALARYLGETRFIDFPQMRDPVFFHTDVTAAGFEAIESRLLSPAVTVFLSSTVYDLVDLRAELADFLESKGFIVLASDDPYRIDVEPTVDTIKTCLRNVESANVVVCILDRKNTALCFPPTSWSLPHKQRFNTRERTGSPSTSSGVTGPCQTTTSYAKTRLWPLLGWRRATWKNARSG